jgi:hypothetical protein
MPSAPDDTHPDARAVLSRRYAAMTPAEKLARVRDLSVSVATLALAGLRTRHPGESEAQLLRRLASLRLGERVAAAAYGPLE